MMGEVIRLPINFIGKLDQRRLEIFGGHMLATGRATSWQWDLNDQGADMFSVYTGATNKKLAAWIERDQTLSRFRGYDGLGRIIAEGPIYEVIFTMDKFFKKLHGNR